MKPRIIKTRAWDAKAKKMLYFEGIFNQRPYTETSTFVQYESIPEYHELEVMEFTGFHDKNGKEIYECDLLATSNDGEDGCDVWQEEGMGVVCWDEKYGRWSHNIDLGSDESIYSLQYVRVVGNTYEGNVSETS